MQSTGSGQPDSAGSYFTGSFREQRVHDVLTVAEIGTLDAVERVGQVQKAMSCGEGQNAQCTGNSKSLAPGGDDSFPVVHQEQVSMKLDGEDDRILFARVEVFQRSIPMKIPGGLYV